MKEGGRMCEGKRNAACERNEGDERDVTFAMCLNVIEEVWRKCIGDSHRTLWEREH